MDVLKHVLKEISKNIMYFLRYKKHLYVKPLFVFILSVIFIISFAIIVSKHEPDDNYKPIQINFNAPTYNLSGVKIVLDPGHGGTDPGAPSIFGVDEAHIVYSVAEKLNQVLTDSGAEVIMTRKEGDTVELDDRKLDGDLFISIHSDAYVNNEASGFTTYYFHDNQMALAENVNQSLDQYALVTNRGTEKMSYQVIWQIDYPGTLVELGYLSNNVDDSLLNDEAYQERMVHGIAEGIENYVKKEK